MSTGPIRHSKPLSPHPQRTRFVTLSDDERAELQVIAADPSQSHARRGRAAVLLLADSGPHGPALSFPEISKQLDKSRAFVSTVVARAAERGAVAAALARVPKLSANHTDPA